MCVVCSRTVALQRCNAPWPPTTDYIGYSECSEFSEYSELSDYSDYSEYSDSPPVPSFSHFLFVFSDIMLIFAASQHI